MKLGIGITAIVITSLLCITGLMLFALSKGFDGIMTSGTIAMLAGVPTWFITKRVVKK